MKLIVSPLIDLDRQLAKHAPAGVVSLLSPGHEAPPLTGDPPRLVLRFHDIAEPAEGLTLVTERQVDMLLTFAAGFAPHACLLLHCWMGISRSPAAAFVLACAGAPPGAEAKIARALRAASPSATPNPRLVALADARLDREGRMSRAAAAIGRGVEASIGAAFALDLEALA